MNDFNKQTERYITLADHLPKLEQMAASGTVLGELALRRALDEMTDLSRSETVIEELNSAWESAQEELVQLAGGGELVELGLVAEDEIKAMEIDIMNRPEIKAATMLRGLGASALEGAVTDTKTPEVEQEMITVEQGALQPLQITLLGNGVQIGERGKFVQLSKRTHTKQRDYSEERKQLLKALVKNQGNDTSVTDLWEEAFPETKVQGRTMHLFRTWSENLTYRKQPIIEHNGLRGSSSAYRIVNFDVSINEVTTKEQKGTLRPPSDSVSTNTSKFSIETDGEKDNQTVSRFEKVNQPKVYFPLSLAEAHILAEVISHYEGYCEQNGIQAMPSGILEGLNKRSTPTQIADLIKGRNILEVRGEIVGKVVDYFEDDKKVLQDITNMKETDARRAFFEYLFEFEDSSDRSKILVAIAEGATSLKIEYGGKRGIDIIAARISTELDEPENSWQSHSSIDEDEEDDSVEPPTTDQLDGIEEADQVLEVQNEPIEVSAEEDPLPLESESDQESDSTELKPNDSTALEMEREQKLAEIESRLSETLELAMQQNVTNRRGANAVRSVFPFITVRHIKNASENGHISRNNDDLSYKDILTLAAMHHYGQEFSVRKSKQSICRRDIESVIKEILKKNELL